MRGSEDYALLKGGVVTVAMRRERSENSVLENPNKGCAKGRDETQAKRKKE